MSILLLKHCGEALYGSRWQSEIARDLEVSDRTVRRWVAGTSDVPDGIYIDLRARCLKRAAELDDVMAEIAAFMQLHLRARITELEEENASLRDKLQLKVA